MKKYYILALIFLTFRVGFGQSNIYNNENLFYASSVSNFVEKTNSPKSTSLETKITSVKCKLILRDAAFNWVSVENKDCKGYYIEKKTGNSKWESIGFINARNEAENYYSYSDKNLQSGDYQYRLKQLFENGKVVYQNFAGDLSIDEPKRNSISHTMPSVFSPFTTIYFQIENSEMVSISILNEEGKIVDVAIDEDKDAGYYEVKLNTRLMKPGKYFYKIKAGNYSDANSFVVEK